MSYASYKGRTNEYYGSVREAVMYSRIEARDVGVETLEDFEMYVETLLRYVRDFINARKRRDYIEEVEKGVRKRIDEGIHFIAVRLVANILGQAKMRKQGLFHSIDDFNTIVLEDKIFTTSIKRDLDMYQTKYNFKIFSTGTKPEDKEEVVEVKKEEDVKDYVSFIATQDIQAGKFVNLYSVEGETKVQVADVTLDRKANGFVVDSVNIGEYVRVYTEGVNDKVSNLVVVGGKYVLGEAGEPVLFSTGMNFKQELGVALGSNNIDVSIGDVIYIQ